MRNLLFALLLLLPAAFPAIAAERPDDARSLQGIEEGRILWDVTLDDPGRLLSRLKVVEQTYRDLERQGVEPRMLLAFRSGAVRLLAEDLDRVELAEEPAVRQVQRKLVELARLEGVTRIEACSLATRRVELSQEDLVEPVVEVGNTFLTAAAYAQRGYARIRLD
ncbi:hypothetical protein AN478_00360 [Thiohalorhabdus denitrificans]|uniref:Intracellular sulfur oxidation protein, DsrE/DsrF family n=1 Tax=Thiohalorhabdus denitrificans TaxID=381306 RepID=A0A0P9CYD6_9GAMM|nr:hypothetical protein [Thiohalorhabdus denitrificans]KPV41886.1 hypothetical protein AN478_00360 [Thiohalorhabdus denitrificans]SCY65449.1 hypothetical protein SAMN05661077_0042 [Thiohalorhabdus denitrificans]